MAREYLAESDFTYKLICIQDITVVILFYSEILLFLLVGEYYFYTLFDGLNK